MFTDITSTAIRAWPLAALGVSRLVVIKGLGYQEHVSEYGVHWNFFATLFCMRLIVVPMNRLRPARVKYGLCIIALGVYQWLLVNGGLSDFVVHSPRDTLFAMNREGVLGLVGFVAIFFIAEELGYQFRAQFQKTEKVRSNGRSRVASAVLCRVLHDEEITTKFSHRLRQEVDMIHTAMCLSRRDSEAQVLCGGAWSSWRGPMRSFGGSLC